MFFFAWTHAISEYPPTRFGVRDRLALYAMVVDREVVELSGSKAHMPA